MVLKSQIKSITSFLNSEYKKDKNTVYNKIYHVYNSCNKFKNHKCYLENNNLAISFNNFSELLYKDIPKEYIINYSHIGETIENLFTKVFNFNDLSHDGFLLEYKDLKAFIKENESLSHEQQKKHFLINNIAFNPYHLNQIFKIFGCKKIYIHFSFFKGKARSTTVLISQDNCINSLLPQALLTPLTRVVII